MQFVLAATRLICSAIALFLHASELGLVLPHRVYFLQPRCLTRGRMVVI